MSRTATYEQDLRIALDSLGGDFCQTYMAVKNLHFCLRREPGLATRHVVGVLERQLAGQRHHDEPHARLMYREAAGALCCVRSRPPEPGLGEWARTILDETLVNRRGKQRLAAADVLGELSVELAAPEPDLADPGNAPSVSLDDILALAGADRATCQPLGRTLTFAAAGGQLLALKLARAGEDPLCLAREAAWMRTLANMSHPARFDVPTPLYGEFGNVVRIRDRAGLLPNQELHADGYALPCLAGPDYFSYAVDPRPGRLPDFAEFCEIMSRSALLMGHLARLGIMHAAPIPLFHNRLQQQRRQDEGLYEWWRLGRLDHWYHSCLHPNFGPSGLRDFEHFESVPEPGRRLFRLMTVELLSLALVTGSWFRCTDPHCMGLDDSGRPVDARHLFDETRLFRVLHDTFAAYHEGFTGSTPPADLDIDLAELTRRMIDEMGVDNHMQEFLRITDQERLSDDEFFALLTSRGYAPGEAGAMNRCAEDIPLVSGPHLGGFNRRISLPEIIEHAASWSALCIAARHFASE